MKRKYHSGLIPAGAETKGSALTPKFHGKIANVYLHTYTS